VGRPRRRDDVAPDARRSRTSRACPTGDRDAVRNEPRRLPVLLVHNFFSDAGSGLRRQRRRAPQTTLLGERCDFGALAPGSHVEPDPSYRKSVVRAAPEVDAARSELRLVPVGHGVRSTSAASGATSSPARGRHTLQDAGRGRRREPRRSGQGAARLNLVSLAVEAHGPHRPCTDCAPRCTGCGAARWTV